MINFQSSRTGDYFYVNLGVQPIFIPAESNAKLSSLKEYECIMRRRVGREWAWTMDDDERAALFAAINATQAQFFGQALTLPQALVGDTVHDLLRKFSAGTTEARATFHLARGAMHFGLKKVARDLANHGIEIAGERATFLLADLRAILETCQA